MKSKIQDLIKQRHHKEIQEMLKTQTELSKTDIHQLIGFAEYDAQENIVSILQEAGKSLMQDKSTNTNIEYSQKDLQQNKNNIVKKLGLHKRSVTPTTLEKVVFDNSEEDFFCKEIYKHKDNSVARFAFNEQLLPYEKFADSKKLDSWKSSTKSAAAIKTNADRIKLHELESDLLTKAISYLEYSQQKTVVVDIFARDQGKIKDDNGLVEIHSIVLFKPDERIYVIDPSNFSFSCHLSNFNQDLIITKYSADKIYEPPSNKSKMGQKLVEKYKSITGDSSDQYRDCIDIAVKLALGINTKEHIDFDFDKILKLDIVQEITNNPEVNTNIIDLDAPVRIKQATQPSIRKNFELLVDKAQKLFKHFFTINDEEKSESYRSYEQNYKQLLETNVDFKAYQTSVVELKGFHDKFYKDVQSLMGEQHETIDLSVE